MHVPVHCIMFMHVRTFMCKLVTVDVVIVLSYHDIISYMLAHTHTHTHTHKRKHTHTYTHTHTHTYTHTHTPTGQ